LDVNGKRYGIHREMMRKRDFFQDTYAESCISETPCTRFPMAWEL